MPQTENIFPDKGCSGPVVEGGIGCCRKIPTLYVYIITCIYICIIYVYIYVYHCIPMYRVCTGYWLHTDITVQGIRSNMNMSYLEDRPTSKW